MHEEEHPINLKKWMDAYPTPLDRLKCPLAEITVEELEHEIGKENVGTKEVVVIDVRRADCLVSYWPRKSETTMPADFPAQSMIPGAINLPAHSFHVALSTLLHLLSPIPMIVFHCGRSNGRGPRAAGWYADALQKHLNLSDEAVSRRVRVLKGGIMAWEAQFGPGSLQERGVTNGKATVQL
jgi:arsenical-resistance protein 2